MRLYTKLPWIGQNDVKVDVFSRSDTHTNHGTFVSILAICCWNLTLDLDDLSCLLSSNLCVSGIRSVITIVQKSSDTIQSPNHRRRRQKENVHGHHSRRLAHTGVYSCILHKQPQHQKDLSNNLLFVYCRMIQKIYAHLI